jgi:DNA primase large subunit
MEHSYIDEIVSILEDNAIHNELDGNVKINVEQVAKALEKMFVVKTNQKIRELKKKQP